MDHEASNLSAASFSTNSRAQSVCSSSATTSRLGLPRRKPLTRKALSAMTEDEKAQLFRAAETSTNAPPVPAKQKQNREKRDAVKQQAIFSSTGIRNRQEHAADDDEDTQLNNKLQQQMCVSLEDKVIHRIKNVKNLDELVSIFRCVNGSIDHTSSSCSSASSTTNDNTCNNIDNNKTKNGIGASGVPRQQSDRLLSFFDPEMVHPTRGLNVNFSNNNNNNSNGHVSDISSSGSRSKIPSENNHHNKSSSAANCRSVSTKTIASAASLQLKTLVAQLTAATNGRKRSSENCSSPYSSKMESMTTATSSGAMMDAARKCWMELCKCQTDEVVQRDATYLQAGRQEQEDETEANNAQVAAEAINKTVDQFATLEVFRCLMALPRR